MFWQHRISLASFFQDKYDFWNCTYVNNDEKVFLVEGSNGFYSTSILFHIIGYNWFQIKQIHLGLDQIIFECTCVYFCTLLFEGKLENTQQGIYFHIVRDLSLETCWFRTIQLAKNNNFHKIIREIPSWYTKLFCQKLTS